MRRRDFLALAGAAAVFPRAALGQQVAKVPRIAFLHPTVPIQQMSETSASRDVAAFLKELRRLGFVEGSTAVIERWSGNGDPATYAAVALSAVASNPDVIYVSDTVMSETVAAATKTIPIVAVTGDVIADGLVANLSHPGGNATGVNTTVDVLAEGSRRMALLHAALPSSRRVGCLSSASGWETLGQGLMDAGSRLGLEVVAVIPKAPVTEGSYRDVFASMALQRVDMVQLVNAPENATFGSLIGNVAAAVRMPGVSYNPAFVDGGGLMSYGPSFDALYRGAAGQVARILMGAKPGDLPVIVPQRFDLTVNLKAAKELSLELPQSIIDAAIELRQ
jgi:putative ABC transport system substrate-binding protein